MSLVYGSQLPLLKVATSRVHHITNCISESTNSASSSNNKKRKEIEIRVCTNRTCRRQGSLQTLQTLTDIAPPFVTVNRCGCLGCCGNGPNLVILPDALMVRHCGTASHAAQLVVNLCGPDVGDAKSILDALALRKRAGND